MASLLESAFEFFFKYRPVVFERGHFALGAPSALWVAGIAGALVAVPAIISYSRVAAKSTLRDRIILGTMRLALLALLAFCLLRPMLVIAAAVPQKNVLGILLDDSRSMQVADRDGHTRSEWVQSALGDKTSPLRRALEERFQLRFFRFSSGADRVSEVSELGYTGGETRLANALSRARQELDASPLSALVLVSDGADNSQLTGDAPAIDEQLHSLSARSVPVFTVGVGRTQFAKDIEINRVEAPRSVLKGASVSVTVMVTQRGYRGQTVQLVVEDSGHIVSTQPVKLPGDGEMIPVSVHVPATAVGPRLLRFRIAPLADEMVAQNNEQRALIEVSDRREKVLYIEGEPRWELKFLRKAINDDPNLQLVTMLRSAENKYLRLGVSDSLELVAGFPKTREELFAYRGIILGSIEASFFTVDQLRMLTDFVSERGGGLLLLGGPRAFAEGGYAGTPLADVMPVTIDAANAHDTSFFSEMHIEPTPGGASLPALQIAGTEEKSLERWKTLPPLSAVNRVRGLKPGASTWLMGTPIRGGNRQIVLASQRYGRGTAIAFPVQDDWLWQMHADIPLGDMTHETFWQQMTRWLVSDVPGRVTIAKGADQVSPRTPLALRAEVDDDIYERMNNAAVTADVTSPSGVHTKVPMEWSVDRDGEYRASVVPEEPGVYTIAVSAAVAGKPMAADTTYVQAAELGSEFFGAQMRQSLLQRIASETGGHFYSTESVQSLPKDIVYTERGTTEMEQKELWDMPAIFFALITLVGAEWGYRRLRGLA